MSGPWIFSINTFGMGSECKVTVLKKSSSKKVMTLWKGVGLPHFTWVLMVKSQALDSKNVRSSSLNLPFPLRINLIHCRNQKNRSHLPTSEKEWDILLVQKTYSYTSSTYEHLLIILNTGHPVFPTKTPRPLQDEELDLRLIYLLKFNIFSCTNANTKYVTKHIYNEVILPPFLLHNVKIRQR